MYMVIGGIFFYLISVVIDPIFIPTLAMPDGFCQKWIETRSGYQRRSECVEFSNKLDQLKYNHNLKMEKRRANKMIGLFIAASVVTFLLMILNPLIFFGSGVTLENYTGVLATAVFYGIILGFIFPTMIQMLMPPPFEWLPEELLEIHRARTALILKEIAKMPK